MWLFWWFSNTVYLIIFAYRNHDCDCSENYPSAGKPHENWKPNLIDFVFAFFFFGLMNALHHRHPTTQIRREIRNHRFRWSVVSPTQSLDFRIEILVKMVDFCTGDMTCQCDFWLVRRSVWPPNHHQLCHPGIKIHTVRKSKIMS